MFNYYDVYNERLRVLDSTYYYNCLLGPSQVSNRRCFNNDEFTNKTTSPLGDAPLCAARNRPIW